MKSPPPISFRKVIVILLIGASLSGILLRQHYSQAHEAGLLSMLCGGSEVSGCEAVNRSEYSSFMGVPLASAGLWFYVTVAMILSLASLASEPVKEYAGRLSFLLLCVGVGVDVVLLGVQLAAIKTLCTLCLMTYAVSFLGMYFLLPYRKKGSSGTLEGLKKESEGRMLLASWAAGTFLAAVAVGAGSIVMSYQDPDTLQEKYTEAAVREFMQSPEEAIDLKDTPMQGSADAKIQVVIYSDFLCPWCRQVAQSFQQNMPKWKDRIVLYYKEYPLDVFCNPYLKTSLHPGACWAALGGICAEDQGKFWEFHDRIFTSAPKNPGSGAIMTIAQEAGLDTTALSACMHEGKMQSKVRQQITAAHTAGIEGTPRIFINGRKLPKLGYLTAILAAEAKRLGLAPLEGIGE